jgi:glutaconate CoA-transferase subunit B
MAVRSVHPGVGRQALEEATGFELGWPADVPDTEPPTAEELRTLRKIDPDGLLRG